MVSVFFCTFVTFLLLSWNIVNLMYFGIFKNFLFLVADALLARRNALLMQQQRLALRRDEAASFEVRLPQEWTY